MMTKTNSTAALTHNLGTAIVAATRSGLAAAEAKLVDVLDVFYGGDHRVLAHPERYPSAGYHLSALERSGQLHFAATAAAGRAAIERGTGQLRLVD